MLLFYSLLQCFEQYTQFDFSSLHDCLLDSFVWPHLSKLPLENLQNPTALLKLLATWSVHPK